MTDNNDDQITLFAETNFRGVKRRFGIKRKDRRRHMYIIGKTGMGKTTLLENMTIQDIQSGEGVGIVDPHGEYAEKMLDFVPASRINDVVYFNPQDIEFPLAFNVMEDVGADRRHLVSSGLLGVFKKIWGPEVWSGRMEYLLSNSILALLETPGTTLLGINRILADKEFRKQIVSNVKDPIVKAFWENEYARYTEKFATEAGAAVQNKIGQFTSNPLIRNIIGQAKSTIDMRKMMDERKIFIMNLSKGRIGEENARLLGAMLITRLYLAAMTRVDLPETERSDFYLYVDEFQNFATESFANILSEARKYRLNLILAHQYVEQMDETVRAAVFGNVGSMVTFRVGAMDAELLEKEMMPEFVQQDLVNLGFASIYLRLMIDGVASRPFSATTLPPVVAQERSHKDEIIQVSRKLYGRDRKDVDREILAWQGFAQGQDGIVVTKKEAREMRPPAYAGKPAQAGREFDDRRSSPALSPGASRPEESPGNALASRPIQSPKPFRVERRPTDGIASGPLRPLQPRFSESREPRSSSRQFSENVQPRREYPQRPQETPHERYQDRSQERYRERPETPKFFSPESRHDRSAHSRDETALRQEARPRPPETRPTPPPLREKQEPQLYRAEPRRPILDIRRAPEPQAPKPGLEKQKSFLSLSQLPKKEKAGEGDGDVSSSQKQSDLPIPAGRQKQKIDFSELKKVLAESFVPRPSQEPRKETLSPLHDRTGMMNLRDPNAPAPAHHPQPEEEKKGKSAGVLKPGERIKF